MCLGDLALDWPPPCRKCGKGMIVIGGTPDFPGENSVSTMAFACPDWPETCDMMAPTPR